MSSSRLHFPTKLYQVIEVESDEIINWENDGKTFRIYDYTRFEKEVIPKYFKHSRIASVQRQLNLYGFKCVNRGEDKGSFYHPRFLRGDYDSVREIRREKQQGKSLKANVVRNTSGESKTKDIVDFVFDGFLQNFENVDGDNFDDMCPMTLDDAINCFDSIFESNIAEIKEEHNKSKDNSYAEIVNHFEPLEWQRFDGFSDSQVFVHSEPSRTPVSNCTVFCGPGYNTKNNISYNLNLDSYSDRNFKPYCGFVSESSSGYQLINLATDGNINMNNGIQENNYQGLITNMGRYSSSYISPSNFDDLINFSLET